MKWFYIVFALLFSASLFAQHKQKTGLLLIDIQDFYFEGGFSELEDPVEATQNAAKILEYFRQQNMLVVHVQHKVKSQMDIHDLVKPKPNEKIFEKSEINCFNGTKLHEYFKSNMVNQLVIVGMQTHMCVEAATRAGYDLGYKMILIDNACATKDLKWKEEIVPAKMTHNATLATLKSYASIVSAQEFLQEINDVE